MKKLVIFDFDGVLVNTMPLWFGIHKEANENFTMEQLSKMSLGNFWNAMDDHIADNKYIKDPRYQERYDEQLPGYTTSLTPIIKALSQKYVLAIVSSGSEPTIKKFLEKEGVDSYFSEILGFQTSRDKTHKFRLAAGNLKVDLENAVNITDTLGDITEANNAPIKSIGVTWGLHDKETLSRGNPAAIINDPKDLIPAIEKVLE